MPHADEAGIYAVRAVLHAAREIASYAEDDEIENVVCDALATLRKIETDRIRAGVAKDAQS